MGSERHRQSRHPLSVVRCRAYSPAISRHSHPSEVEISGALKRLLATVVVSDSHVTRREEQLRELLHVLLIKLESDAFACRSANIDKPVAFGILGDSLTRVALTAQRIREQYREYYHKHRQRIFNPSDREEMLLDDATIFAAVAELGSFRILGDDVDLLSKAFQIFRVSAFKSGEGQYLTPPRVVRSAVMAMEITSADKVIDPACGSGGFISEVLRQVAQNEFPEEEKTCRLAKWANDHLYAIDKDDIGIKLTRAMMVAMRNNSTHAMLGDMIRSNLWSSRYPRLYQELGNPAEEFGLGQFTAVVTNPPFGAGLKIKAADCRAAGYTISNHAAMKGPTDYVDLEIGLVYLEQCYRLLRTGGRIGIILPETYFFSHSYRWLPYWLEGRLALRGMLNIPMEAFEEFCRAKTNFYIFEKTGCIEKTLDSLAVFKESPIKTGIHKPVWFSDETVMVSTAPTCGLTRGGRMLPIVNSDTGKRIQEIDPETGVTVDVADDKLKDDVIALGRGVETRTLRFIPATRVSLHCAVPVYYDDLYIDHFKKTMQTYQFKGFRSCSLGDMIENCILEVRGGHGSPSQDARIGHVPYIKVSDLRAGLVNINPTNRVPLSVAEKFWNSDVSGLAPFDIMCPERTSRNIGDFCILLPGQEQVVLTREIIVLRPGMNANFDSFYLLWALSLKVVRDQWRRIIFMQTNRDDVGKRYLEILFPVPPSREHAMDVSKCFREYYQTLSTARSAFARYLNQTGQHHFFISGAEEKLPSEQMW